MIETLAAVIATITLQDSITFTKEPIKQMHTTAYCQGEITATGTTPREGIAATDKAHLGCIAVIYENNNGEPGELITILNCEDTGKGGDRNNNGVGDIIEGLTIDVYRNDLDGVRDWAKRTQDEVFVQYIKMDRSAGTETAQSATPTSKKGYTYSVTERKENANTRRSAPKSTGATGQRSTAQDL